MIRSNISFSIIKYIKKRAKRMFLKLILYCLENEGHILLLVLAIENACFEFFKLSIIVKNLKNL